jgi:hypothetical protein
MKKLTLLFALLGVVALAGAAGAANTVVTGPGQTTVINNPNPDTICPGSLFMTNDDGSYENGYAWAYAGVVAPYYGAWAEGFTASGANKAVCGMKFGLTQVGAQDGWLMDVYVWDALNSAPNNVLCMTAGVNPGTIGMWPAITQHDVALPQICCVPAEFFVGWWPTWVGTGNGWYVAADENGFGGGIPRTNIAPGIGYPTGWNNPNVVSSFAGCMDLGIGAYEVSCEPVPADNSTWGAIKALYN